MEVWTGCNQVLFTWLHILCFMSPNYIYANIYSYDICVLCICVCKNKSQGEKLQKFKGIKDIKPFDLENIGRVSDVHELSIVRKIMNYMCVPCWINKICGVTRAFIKKNIFDYFISCSTIITTRNFQEQLCDTDIFKRMHHCVAKTTTTKVSTKLILINKRLALIFYYNLIKEIYVSFLSFCNKGGLRWNDSFKKNYKQSMRSLY